MGAVGGYDPDQEDELDFEDDELKDAKPALPRRVPSQGRRTVREDVRRAAESVDAGDLGDALKIVAEVTAVQEAEEPKVWMDHAEVLEKFAERSVPEVGTTIHATMEKMAQAHMEYHDHDTLDKVNQALRAANCTTLQAIDIITELQNAGILFRERVVDAEPTVGSRVREVCDRIADEEDQVGEDQVGDKYAGEPAKAVSEESFEQRMVRVIPYHAFVKPSLLAWEARWSTSSGVWSVTLNVGVLFAPSKVTIQGPGYFVQFEGSDAELAIKTLHMLNAL